MAEEAAARRRMSREFTAVSFFWRFLAALALVFATYNPTQHSYFHWVRSAITELTVGPEHFFVGALLLIGWAILLFATRNSLGIFGVLLGATLLGTAVWLLIDLGVLYPNSFSSITWIVLVCVAGLLAIGLSWSHIWRRLTGQLEVTDENE
jgi:hypothetical protein